MFDIGFSIKDFVRSLWALALTFVVVFFATASGIVRDLISSCATHCDVATAKSAGIAALVALGVSILTAVKNLLLQDGTALKG